MRLLPGLSLFTALFLAAPVMAQSSGGVVHGYNWNSGRHLGRPQADQTRTQALRARSQAVAGTAHRPHAPSATTRRAPPR